MWCSLKSLQYCHCDITKIFLKSSEWDQSTQNFMLIQLKNVQKRKKQKTLAHSSKSYKTHMTCLHSAHSSRVEKFWSPWFTMVAAAGRISFGMLNSYIKIRVFNIETTWWFTFLKLPLKLGKRRQQNLTVYAKKGYRIHHAVIFSWIRCSIFFFILLLHGLKRHLIWRLEDEAITIPEPIEYQRGVYGRSYL